MGSRRMRQRTCAALFGCDAGLSHSGTPEAFRHGSLRTRAADIVSSDSQVEEKQ
jgi:hypothetical protein